jgi:hypothetical protein
VAGLATDHQETQAGLAVLAAREVASAWRLIQLGDLRTTLPRFAAAVAALVQRYGLASASLAADYYDSARAAAGISGRFTVMPADPPGLDQVEAEVGWATRVLWSAEPDTESARTMVTGAADRMVLDTGRATISDAVQSDRAARGWARVPEAGCCAFCAMLATRGAVYKTEQTADFRAHDHDRCHIEPVFGQYEPTAQVREWQALWEKSTAGKSGAAARAAFRKALGHN